MYDAKDLLKIMKQAAMEAVAAANPVTVCTGTVISAAPLKVKVEQKMTLTENQLVKCREIGKIEKDHNVVLLREQGGQKYIILGVI